MLKQAIIIIKALGMHHKLMTKNNKVTFAVKKCENIIPNNIFSKRVRKKNHVLYNTNEYLLHIFF